MQAHPSHDGQHRRQPSTPAGVTTATLRFLIPLAPLLGAEVEQNEMERATALEPGLRFDATCLDGGAQRRVVEFVLVGVELGEVRERPVHGVA